jgi:hypothetical protein
MKTYGHLRDEHSTTMAQKVTFVNTSTPNEAVAVVDKPSHGHKANGGSQTKTAAQARAAYSYPWWASNEAMEVFWGQANEPVQIVPLPKYLQNAKAAMGREVFEQELAEPQVLLEEFAARAGEQIIEKLKARISPTENGHFEI